MAFAAGNKLRASTLNSETIGPVTRSIQANPQNIPTGTWTKILLDTNVLDLPGGAWAPATNNIIPAQVGLYLAGITGAYLHSAAGARFVQLYMNGNAQAGVTAGMVATSGTEDGVPFSATYPVQSSGLTDTFELWTWQDSGGTLATFHDTRNCCSLSVTYQRASS